MTRAIDQQPGPVILVGLSWGGAVITQAGVNAKVAALVYVAAFALEAGQSIMIDPLLQQGMAAQINANVIKVRAGHTVLLSHPHRVVEAILQAARLSD